MKCARITQARVEQLAIEIKQAARFARGTDPGTRGHVSYPAMCGGLQAILRGFVREACGEKAAAVVDAAFKAVDDETRGQE